MIATPAVTEEPGRTAGLFVRWAWALVTGLMVHVVHPLAVSAQTCEVQVVSRAELLRAMRLHGNYNLVATPNLARFQTDVFLQLARWARSRSPQGDPLFVGPEDWFQGYAEVTGVTRETAPEAIRRALEVGQLTQLDYRTDHVIEEPGDGPKPLNAMNVRIWWEPIPSGPSKYSYRDTISTPNLSVTNQQMITFRLLEFDDKIVYDQVRGLSGRPTTGLLGLLFRLIGEGEVVESRMTISTDGLQIVVARSKKVFTVPVTATVHPDGRGEKGVPDGRADLEAIEGRLRRPVPVRYVPYAC